jgi:dienelactone hydrolase
MSSEERFREGLERPEVALSIDMSSDSRTLLIAFGGMVGRIGMPPFEFFALTGGMPIKRVFVRDLRQAWYHRGIPGHGETLADCAESLRKLIGEHDVDRVLTTGNSAGGYAALVFGALLGAETVLCFAPQTVLDRDALAAMDDHRWDDRLAELAAAGALDERWSDVRRALAGARRPDTRYRIYFDDSFAPDRLHAERLSGIAGVQLYRFGRGRHSVARTLRDTGALEKVLRGALDVSASSEVR